MFEIPKTPEKSEAQDEESLAKLRKTLGTLETKHGEFLKQEFVKQEVSILKHTVEDYLNGSPEAKEYLSEHAVEIISDVKNKLDGAVIEQTRLQEESQMAANFTGGKVDRASQAAAKAAEAKAMIETVFEETTSDTERA